MIDKIKFIFYRKRMKKRLTDIFRCYKRLNHNDLIYNWENIFGDINIKPNDEILEILLSELVSRKAIKVDKFRTKLADSTEYVLYNAEKDVILGR